MKEADTMATLKTTMAWTTVLALVAAAGGLAGWNLAHRNAAPSAASEPGHPAPAVAKPGADTAPGGGRRILYWHDPMVPGTKFDKPGKSPFMDMQLVPVYADEAAGSGGVTISPRTVQNLGIRTVAVAHGEMGSVLDTVGTVAIDERLLVAVQTRVNGYVEKLYARAQFDAVRKGQALAEIYAPDWLAAQEEYLTLARSPLAGSNELAAAARRRLALLGVAESQIARIERDGKANARVTLYAPDSGIVWEIGAREGQAIGPGTTLFKLAALDTVWVNAEVPEAQSALVTPGTRVVARSAAAPSHGLEGKVAAILPDVNATTRTLKARIVLANRDGALKPGMFVSLRFSGAPRQSLLVPSESVIYTGRRNVVIVAEGDGRFGPVDVEVGGESGEMTEIRKGLQAGQRVVASGQFLIDSESSLKGALDRLNDAGGVPGGSPAPGK
jgi:Cu(I)/Ag(I) efflux system membrane fusion protein